MFGKFPSLFRPTKAAAASHPQQWLEKQLAHVELNKRFSKEQLQQTKQSLKVFYNQHYFPHPYEQGPFSLSRILTHVPAVNVEGDKEGFFQNGLPFPIKARDFFSRITPDHPELLSPAERLIGGKKIIYSCSTAFASGGYPLQNARRFIKEPFSVGIFSLAGASFENTYLHYSRFMLDPLNTIIQKEPFAHWYDNLPTTLAEAQTLLGKNGYHPMVTRVRSGLSWLVRNGPEKFSTSFFAKNSVLFLGEAYYRHQLEDISMLLTAVNETALDTGKPALLKATAVGMGFFARIDGHYDLQYMLFPYYLRAYKKLLSENSYPGIAAIEFPIFNEMQEEQFSYIWSDFNGTTRVYSSQRDVLEYSEKEKANFFCCCINPSDANAYTGNEWGDGSVESMIGNNTSLRFDQVHWLNPLVLNKHHHMAVLINEKSFSGEIVQPGPHLKL